MKRSLMIDYLESSLKMFVLDPPDSDYNEGFLAAIKEAYKTFTKPGERNEALLRAIDKIE